MEYDGRKAWAKDLEIKQSTTKLSTLESQEDDIGGVLFTEQNSANIVNKLGD